MLLPLCLRCLRIPAGFAAALCLLAASVFGSEEQRVVEKIVPTPAPVLNPDLPTLWIAGDSTAANGTPDATGWGKPLSGYFDPTKINVANRARGGRSSKTFVTEGLWDQLMAQLKKGDVVLIQFGHNDGGSAVFTGKARASLPGLGEETQEGVFADGKTGVAHTFGWYMRKMIGETKAKGATPILLSLTIRQRWQDGKIERASGKYSQWTAELARSEGAAFLDLSTMIADEYDKLGEEKLKAFFPKDYVHTGPAGADLSASLVVAGLKGLRVNPFGAQAPYSEKGAAIAASPLTVLDAPAAASASTAERPRRRVQPVPANPQLPSVFLIGDSTVRNGQGDGSNGQWGWGEPLAGWFDPTKINIVNRAVGGLSSRTFLTGGHWERALAMIKPGDVVIMQFGHNDNGPINDNTRARGTIKGIGDETQEIDNLLTKRPEVVHTYGWYLKKFITDTRSKGAAAIVCSLVPRKIWKDGKIVRAKDDYAGWAEAAAKEVGASFIDLNELIAVRYDKLGQEKVNALFADEHTHTNRAGAELNAECVKEGLSALLANPLEQYFVVRPASAGK